MQSAGGSVRTICRSQISHKHCAQNITQDRSSGGGTTSDGQPCGQRGLTQCQWGVG